MIVTILGGIGLFLLGMILLIDGLRSVAGGGLRRILVKTVGGPLSGLAAGAAVTAMVQSSSATTVATIGFVSAGLLTFPQSIGVVFGANLGTTSTSWLVALVGFRLSIAAFAMPLVAAGAALRLLGRERVAAAGLAIAGFGLLFIGLDLLQQGMAGLAERFGPEDLPDAASVEGRLLLLGIGVAMTVVMQSSSAAVATTLVALHSGAVGFEQAASMVIGQNLGTTVTAALAAVGAAVPARRTAVAHILFNAITAGLALGLFPWLVAGSLRAAEGIFDEPETVALAAFQTSVKLAGIAVLLPATIPFGHLVSWMVPQRREDLVRHLDLSVISVGPVANEAMRRTATSILARASGGIAGLLDRGIRDASANEAIRASKEGLRKASLFAASLGSGSQRPREMAEYLSLLHALDHLSRLLEGVADAETLAEASREPSLAPQRGVVLTMLEGLAGGEEAIGGAAATRLGEQSAEIAAIRRDYRVATLAATARVEIDPDASLRRLDASRAIDRIGYHLWRAALHLVPPDGAAAAEGTVEVGTAASP